MTEEATEDNWYEEGYIEWKAWQALCAECDDIGFSVNDQRRFVAAVRIWGERLAQLRRVQGDGAAHSIAVICEEQQA